MIGNVKMARKTPPFKYYPLWTTARFWAFIRSALRQAHIKWPPSQAVMRHGRRPKQLPGRHKFEHQCEVCEQWVPQKEIEKDHRVAVGSLRGYEDLPGFVLRLFVDESGYRKICKPCHKAHTKAERAKSTT